MNRCAFDKDFSLHSIWIEALTMGPHSYTTHRVLSFAFPIFCCCFCCWCCVSEYIVIMTQTFSATEQWQIVCHYFISFSRCCLCVCVWATVCVFFFFCSFSAFFFFYLPHFSAAKSLSLSLALFLASLFEFAVTPDVIHFDGVCRNVDVVLQFICGRNSNGRAWQWQCASHQCAEVENERTTITCNEPKNKLEYL